MKSLHRGLFPTTRMRRMRSASFARRLMRETVLTPSDLIYPVFILEGKNQRESIASMPGIERLSIDLLTEEAKTRRALAIPAIALFPVTPASQKSWVGEEAYRSSCLVHGSVQALKDAVRELGISTDVAVD